MSQQQKECINKMIEAAILEAEKKGVKVMSLGLLNQACNTYNLVILMFCKFYREIGTI